MYFIQEYSGFLVDANGSVNSEGLRLAMDVEDVPPELRHQLCKDIALYLTKALKAQRG